jgi:hypothetical protein
MNNLSIKIKIVQINSKEAILRVLLFFLKIRIQIDQLLLMMAHPIIFLVSQLNTQRTLSIMMTQPKIQILFLNETLIKLSSLQMIQDSDL